MTSLALGNAHSCGLTAAGAVYCWGHEERVGHEDGQRPAPVADLPPVTELSVGAVHTCALTAEGDAYCWGDNDAYPRETAEAYATPEYIDTFPADGRLVFIGNTWCMRFVDNGLERLECEGRIPNSGFYDDGFHQIGLHLRGGPCVIEGRVSDLDAYRTYEADWRFLTVQDRALLRSRTEGGWRTVSWPAEVSGVVAGRERWICADDPQGQIWCGQPGTEGVLAYGERGQLSTVAVGEAHGCGLQGDGRVFCWGPTSPGSSATAPGRPESGRRRSSARRRSWGCASGGTTASARRRTARCIAGGAPPCRGRTPPGRGSPKICCARWTSPP